MYLIKELPAEDFLEKCTYRIVTEVEMTIWHSKLSVKC